MALIKENARVAARIAVELEKLQSGSETAEGKSLKSTESSSSGTPIAIIGGSILDVHYRVNEETTLEVSEYSKLIITRYF